MPETTAKPVADFLIELSHERREPVSNLKLQKLLYYAQAWFLAFYDKSLFGERIEAWVHGPVVPPIFGEFKRFRWGPIDRPDAILQVSPLVSDHIAEIMRAYGDFTAGQLERITHSEAPWREARHGLAPDEPSNAIISLESMKAYYQSLLEPMEGQAVEPTCHN